MCARNARVAFACATVRASRRAIWLASVRLIFGASDHHPLGTIWSNLEPWRLRFWRVAKNLRFWVVSRIAVAKALRNGACFCEAHLWGI